MKDVEELHRGALGGHRKLVRRQDAIRHQAKLIVVLQQRGGELPHSGKVSERPAVGNRAMWLLLGDVDEVRGVGLRQWRTADDAVAQVCDD